MRKINRIIVHHTADDYGDVSSIRKYHTEVRGWSDIGYHFVILNGHREEGSLSYDDVARVEMGRPLQEEGAHCRGANSDSIGIALVGNFMEREPHRAMILALMDLIAQLIRGDFASSVISFGSTFLNDPHTHIQTHREAGSHPTLCAGDAFPIKHIRATLRKLYNL